MNEIQDLDNKPTLTAEMIDILRQKVNPDTGKRFTQNDIAALYGISRQ